jgi:putative ABC transport system substrate-binding protein
VLHYHLLTREAPMLRRGFLALLCAAATGFPAVVASQQGPTRRIAVLMGVPREDPEGQARAKAFQRGLREAGWLEGQTIEVEYYWGAADPEIFRNLAAELVLHRPEAILANTPPAVAALRDRTSTIPIVFTGVSAPVEAGFVETLARPGGNITGFATFDPLMGGKWVEILKELAPSLTRIAVMFNPRTATARGTVFLPPIEAAAREIPVDVLTVSDGDDIDRKIETFARDHPKGGLIVAPDPFTTTHRTQSASTVARYGVPAVYPYRWFGVAGGLVSYGTDVLDQFRRAGSYVDRILKGENPRDLPVQAPTKFEFIVNLKSAAALNIVLPPGFLARADEVIE